MYSTGPTEFSTEGFPKHRRHRAVVVCTNCRRRKIKCDKEQPCSNCVSGACSHPCEYDKPLISKAEDPYTSELKLNYQGNFEGQRKRKPLQSHLGQFSVMRYTDGPKAHSNQTAKSQNQPDIRTGTTSDLPTKAIHAGQQKSEIQVLKERLEKIEKSLLKPESKSPAASSSIILPFDKTLKRPFSSIESPDPISTRKQSEYVASPLVQGSDFGKTSILDTMTDQGYNSFLPPLASSLKHEPERFPFSRPGNNESESPMFSSSLSSTTPNYSFHASESSASQGSAGYTSRFDTQMRDYLMIGKNIYGNPIETMNFYEHYSSLHQKDDLRRVNFGPFAWSSLMRRDQGLYLIWEHIKEKKENSVALVFVNATPEVSQETTKTMLEDDKDPEKSERQFEKRALETDGIEEIIPYSSILRARSARSAKSPKASRSAFQLGLTYYDIQINRQLDTIEKIKSALPNKSIIWKLVHRFFDAVYVYMPYLDEEHFRNDISRIIGPESHDEKPVSEVKIERKLDLAVVGILLTILRLGYLSLLSNNTDLTERILTSENPTPEIQEMKYLLANPIPIDIIKVATLCLDQFQLMRRANFTVLQLVLYLRIYRIFAPEDGDGADGGCSQALDAILLQMCYQLGLNREPDDTCTNLKMNNLARKIWYFVCLMDVHMASCFGNPLSIDDRFHDTKYPFFAPGAENLINKSRDGTILDRYLEHSKMFLKTKEILRETLDINNRISLSRLASLLTHWEMDYYQHTGSLKDCLEIRGSEQTSLVGKNFEVKVYLSSKSFLMTMHFHMYLYYEPKNVDISFFYYKKCLLTSTADVMPHYSALLRNSEVVSDMVINPTLEMFVHKSIMVYLSGIIRVNFVIHHMRESGDHLRRCSTDPSYKYYFQKACQLSSCLTRAAEYTISAINKISHRYYYAWRITKSQTVLLKNATSLDFYQGNYDRAYKLYCQKYSSQQLDELINICENTLASFRNSEFSTYGYSHKAETQLSRPTNAPNHQSSYVSPEAVTDLETDKLWLQILSWKHDVSSEFQQEGYASTAGNPINDPRIKVNAPGLQDQNISFEQDYTNDLQMTADLDIFSDMPFNGEYFG